MLTIRLCVSVMGILKPNDLIMDLNFVVVVVIVYVFIVYNVMCVLYVIISTLSATCIHPSIHFE